MDTLIKISAAVVLCAAWLPLAAQEERALVREGNKLYILGMQHEADSIELAVKTWDEAALKYKEALRIDSNLVEGIFNLGDVAFNKGDYEEAMEKFEEAIAATDDPAIKALAHYNIGNCQLKMYDFEKSIAAYKSALRLVPGDMDAKYNLAYAQQKLKKKMEEEGEQDDQEDQQASVFAKELKKKAEELVQQKQYSEAYDLMEAGMQKDTTVKVFKEFIERLKDVADVAAEADVVTPPDSAGLKP